MPDLVQQLIPNIPRIGAVFALFPVCFKVFAWVEDRLSINAKEEISAWLKSTGSFASNQISTFNLSHFHSQLFGDKQFSFKCGMRTLLFSFISFTIIFFPIIFGFVTLFFKNDKTKVLFAMPGQAPVPVVSDWTGGLSGVIVLLFIFTFVVLPLDFIGIGVTRVLAVRSKNNIGIRNGLFIFVIDTLAKSIIFPIIYMIFGILIVVVFFVIVMAVLKLFIKADVPIHFIDFYNFVVSNIDRSQAVALLHSAAGLYKSLIPSLLLCSAWVWLYLIGLHGVRRAVFLFDVDKQPVRSIGIIGAAVLTAGYGLFTAIGPNLSPGAPVSLEEIASRDQQEKDQTLAGLTEAIRLAPKSAGLFMLRAGVYWNNKDYDAAIADLSEAIKLNPNSASLFLARGNSYHAKQDYDRAIADNAEAIRLDPNYAVAFNNRGWALAAKHDYDRAIADYTESVRLDPKYAVAFNNRGDAYFAKHDYERAIADHSVAIRLDQSFAVAFNDRGLAYAAKHDYDRAIADYSEAIRLDPKYAIAYSNRGFAYAAKQDYDRAIAGYNEAIRLNPNLAVTFSFRGRAYAAKQDYDRTIADCSEAIRLNPNSPYAVLWLYLARSRSNAETAAAELKANAKNLNLPDWPYPVVELFLGRRTPQTLLEAATKPDEQCQAQFYSGEWHLLRGNHEAAGTAMKAAVDSCSKTLMEYDAARAELQRLQP